MVSKTDSDRNTNQGNSAEQAREREKHDLDSWMKQEKLLILINLDTWIHNASLIYIENFKSWTELLFYFHETPFNLKESPISYYG